MGNVLKEILERQIQLASQVTKGANESALHTHECNGCTLIKLKTENLAELILWIAQQRIEYDRPILRIMDEVEKLLGKALTLVLKCGGSTKCLINDRDDDDDAFKKLSKDLENCVRDVKWLRDIYKFGYDGVIYSCLSIAGENRDLAMIWASIKELYKSSEGSQLRAAQDLLSLIISVNPRVKKLVIEEGGVLPLLKLLKDGNMEEQEAAADIIEILPQDLESVEQLIDAGVFPVFAKILKVGPMKVQAQVLSAIGNLTDVYPKCQDICIQKNIIGILIDLISSELIQEHVQNFIPINKATSVLAIVRASSHSNKAKAIGYDDNQGQIHSNSLSCENIATRQLEDPDTKAYLKAMAASTLRKLLKDNTTMSRIIAESKALMCFITLLAEGPRDVQYHSIMVLRDITAIAEQDSDLRRSVFKPSSPPWKPLIGSMIRILERPDPADYIILPCVQTIGNLARTFRVAETRIITALVKFLDIGNMARTFRMNTPFVKFLDHTTESALELRRESLTTLLKFTSKESHLHVDHSNEIVLSGGLSRIIQVIYSAERSVQELGIVLLCYVVLDVPDCDELGRIKALKVLQWAFKRGLTKKEEISALVKHAKSRLENYQAETR